MADITLSSAVRNNLLSLQNTAELLGKTQERLATGLKVNSALDDPTAFFTAASLESRSGDLNRLLDSVGLAVQTVEAADAGITAITDLVESAEAAARQALQATGPQTTSTVTGSASATYSPGTNSGVVGTGAAITARVTGTATLVGGNTLDTYSFANGDTVVLTTTTGTTTFTVTNAATEDVNDLVTGLDANGGATVSLVGGNLRVNVTDGGNATLGEGGQGTNLDDLGLTAGTTTSQTADLLQFGFTDGDTVSITIGATQKNVTIGAAGNEVNTLTELNTELATIINGSASSDASGNVSITAGNNTDTITLAGSFGGTATLGSFGLSAGEFSNLVGGTGAPVSQGDSLTLQVGANAASTITFGTGTSEVNTLAELNTALAGLAGGTATADSTTGAITITATNTADAITITEGSGGEAAAFGLTTGVFNSVTTNSSERAAREAEFNNLLTQIDQLARDASFNGNNLLQSDNLTVIFNEDSTSSLTINGVDFDSGGLGISTAATNAFQTDANINTTLSQLDTATTTLRSQAATFGSNISVVEVREQFTKELTNVLETGAAELTLADSNEEGANLLALQTRQQLSTVALSLASQADQQVLRLF